MEPDIIITRDDRNYYATFTDATIIDAMGTATLPLPYTAEASKSAVLARVRENNPADRVEFSQ